MAEGIERLEGKIDAMRETISSMASSIAVLTAGHSRIETIEGRIGALERWKAWVLGAGAAVAALCGFGGHFLAKAFDQPAQAEHASTR